MSRRTTPMLALVAALCALLATLLAPMHAAAAPPVAANPHERGPAPSELDLTAPTGPFAYQSFNLTATQTGTGLAAATIFHPSEEVGTFGAVAIVPGFTNNRSAVSWYGPLLASHGYVVMTIDTLSGLDFPAARATQQLRALDYLTGPNNPVGDLVDPDRLAVMGYSMGGGGAIEATSRRTSIKASIPLTPWHGTKSFPQVVTPTLVIGAQNDGTAPVSTHARPLYEGLSSEIDKAYYELRGAPHSVPTSYDPTIAELSVSWMKRFVDNDYRYDSVLCPHSDDTVTFSDVRSTCAFTPDTDGDGISDPYDHCSDTVLPDVLANPPAASNANAKVTTARQDRFAADEDGRFVTSTGVDSGVTLTDTGGCSAAQIISATDAGQGHAMFGITSDVLDAWVAGLTTAS
jgi:dienelactone hydrolase